MKYILLLVAILSLAAADDVEWVKFYEAFMDQQFNDLKGWHIENAYQGNTFSECSGTSLVGGYNAFGRHATATQQFRLPPHYMIFIRLQLWKIDSWDNEKMQAFIDGYLWEQVWGVTDGGVSLCGQGGNWNEQIWDVWFQGGHNSPGMNFVLTSTLDEEANNESWAFRNFEVYYVPCPADCGLCHNGDVNDCRQWDQIAMSWMKPEVSREGWNLEGGVDGTMTCAGIQIYGGQGHVGRGSVLSKKFDNIPPHYKILVKFQFWKIDSWDNEQFQFYLDNQMVYAQNFQWNEGISLCGHDNRGWAETVVNYDQQLWHKAKSAEIKLTSTLDEDFNNESWGIRDFFFLIAKCTTACLSCWGPGPSDCAVCEQGFILENGKCIQTDAWKVLVRNFMDHEFTDLFGWVLEGHKNPEDPFTKCGAVKLVGGYNRFGKGALAKRTFRIPSHSKIRIQMQLWKIDSWDSETIFIQVDGQRIFEKTLGFNDPNQYNLCGNPNPNWKEYIMVIDSIVEHKAKTAEILISSTLDEDPENGNESWGFRAFSLIYEAAPECAIFYSECNYQGSSFELCDSVPNVSTSFIKQAIKSIEIPEGVVITGFDETDYKGKKLVYYDSVECIDYQFSLMQVETQSKWVRLDENALGVNLRKSKID